MSDAVTALIAAEGLPADYRDVVDRHWAPLAQRIASEAKRPLLVGINGAQGSGKSTLCRFLELLLEKRGLRAVTLALDNLYLPKAERAVIAEDHHPLFATRGVPGTHDVALGESLLDGLIGGSSVQLPRFDKSTDDRALVTTAVSPPIDVILFEGWCVGAVPQPAAALREPVNALEVEADSDGAWRREVNRRLATDYASLFERIDLLIMLKVADFRSARVNRGQQESKLAARNPGAPGLMDEAALNRFMMHYERLTRWMLAEMPVRADVIIPIGPDQRPI